MENNETLDLNNSETISSNLAAASGSTRSLSTESRIIVACMFVTMTAILFGNSLVIIAMARFRSLHDVTGVYVGNLAVADMIVGLAHPFQISAFFYPEMSANKYFCTLTFGILTFAFNASVFSLMCVVIERYISIAYPLRYPSVVTRKLSCRIILCIWIVDFALAVIQVLFNNFDAYNVCVYSLVTNKYIRVVNELTYLLLATLMALIYFKIFWIARGHNRQIQSELSLYPGDPYIRAMSKQMNAVFAIIVALFHVSWLPFCIVQLVMFDPEQVTRATIVVSRFLTFFGVMNSIINPIVYAWRNENYRAAFKKILRIKTQQDNL